MKFSVHSAGSIIDVFWRSVFHCDQCCTFKITLVHYINPCCCWKEVLLVPFLFSALAIQASSLLLVSSSKCSHFAFTSCVFTTSIFYSCLLYLLGFFLLDFARGFIDPMMLWARGHLVVLLMKLGPCHGSMLIHKISAIYKQVLWVHTAVCVGDLYYWLLWCKQMNFGSFQHFFKC